MDKKEIIFFAPTLEDGGVEKNLKLISNFLVTKFKNITLITSSKNQKKEFKNKIKFIIPKIKFVLKFSRRLKFIICFYLFFKKLLKSKNPTVISFQGNIYSIIVCKLLSVKIIIRSNISPEGWPRNRLKFFLYKIVYSFADKIIVNSKSFKKRMKSILNLNATCIYNPLDKTRIKSLSQKKIKFNFFKLNNLNILNIGRLVDQKNQKCLINALIEVKNIIPFKLLIIGNGKNKQDLIKMVKQNNMTKDVKFLPFIKNPYPYFLKSNLFILSSIYEGLPNVLLEAITLNNFIISSNCPTGPKEILKNGKGGLLFKNNDHLDLKNKLIYYYKNRISCNKRKKIAYKNLIKFDEKNNLNKYYKIIKGL